MGRKPPRKGPETPRTSKGRTAGKKKKVLRSLDDLGLTPIKYDDLRQKVLSALRDAGFDWLQNVELASHPLQRPNWSVRKFAGLPPDGSTGFELLTHPTVIDLQKQYARLPASLGQ